MSISIFAKKPIRARSDGRLQRVSSIIRGWQIAERLGAKLNPETGYEEDVCVYVKPHVKLHEDFEFKGKSGYLDIVDGWMLLPIVKRHPEVGIITCSYPDFEYVSRQVTNKVFLIPQHHANFERNKRIRSEVTKVGIIGAKPAFNFLPPELKPELQNRNMELVEFSNFRTREDIKNFYLNIDVQIVWRPYMRKNKIPLSNPLKLVNAAAFGVPTIALSEPAFTEMRGCYYPVERIKDFFRLLDRLRNNKKMFDDISGKCIERSERYHIDSISKLYTALR